MHNHAYAPLAPATTPPPLSPQQRAARPGGQEGAEAHQQKQARLQVYIAIIAIMLLY